MIVVLTVCFFPETPKPPILALKHGMDNTLQYRVNEVLMASCTVADGRPVANLSWYLGKNLLTPLLHHHQPWHAFPDDQELTEGLDTSIVSERDQLYTRSQNLTRTLRTSDHSKSLKCVASHPAYPNGFSVEQTILIVQCNRSTGRFSM